MKCSTCKKESGNYHVYALLGPVCNDCETASDRPKKIEARLKKFITDRKLNTYPDELAMHEFERLVLQVCYIYLSIEKFRDRLMYDPKINRLMLIPSQLSLAVKEQIVDWLPSNYVTTRVNSGIQRWTSGGTFMFKNGTLPKALALKGLEHLEIPFPKAA